MSQIELFEAYSRLEGLKNNIPNKDSIRDNYVIDYHSILDLLEKITNINLSGFRVPSEELKPYQWHTGDTTREKYCPRPVLMMKVDAVLMFFRFQMGDSEKKPIGFSVN